MIIKGVAIEGLLALRRSLQSRKILLKISSFTRRGLEVEILNITKLNLFVVFIILLFGVNVASGYFAMLVGCLKLFVFNFRYYLLFSGCYDLLCGIVHLYGCWLVGRTCYL